jgi:hypothetical protein
MDSSGNDALIAIAGRLDKKPIRIAQAAAAAILKKASKSARLDSDETRRGVTMSYHQEIQRIKNLKREIGPACGAAIVASNKEIALSFAVQRREQADADVLALAISSEDQRAGVAA